MRIGINTPNFVLRRLRASDLVGMRELESDPDVMQFTSYRVIQSEENTRARLEKNIANIPTAEPFGIWIAETRAGEFVGWFMLAKTTMLYLELGFMILKKHWGKGYTSEIAQSILQHAKDDLGVRNISARASAANLASLKVLHRLGFQLQEKIIAEDGEALHLLVWRAE